MPENPKGSLEYLCLTWPNLEKLTG